MLDLELKGGVIKMKHISISDFCKTCEARDENGKRCQNCLDTYVNLYTSYPINYKAKDWEDTEFGINRARKDYLRG